MIPIHLTIPLAFMAILLFALALCIAWAPFAALICALMAHRRGLSVGRYAVLGFVCSALIFLPWLRLTRWLRGKPVERINIKFDISAAYWLAASVLACGIVLLVTGFMDCISFLPLSGCSLPAVEFVVQALGSIVGGTLLLGLGLKSASRANAHFWKRETERELRAAIDVPNAPYTAPMAWALASILIGAGIWYELIWRIFD